MAGFGAGAGLGYVAGRIGRDRRRLRCRREGDIGAGRGTVSTAIALGAVFMSASGLVFLTLPGSIVRLYTRDPAVDELGSALLMIAAVFQLFDGTQGVAIGALRGAGDTRTAMLTHLVCDWCIGLPVAWYFCFERGWGAAGLWIGLSLAMILAGALLAAAWARKVRVILAAAAQPG